MLHPSRLVHFVVLKGGEGGVKQLYLHTRAVRAVGRLHLDDLSPRARARLRWFDWYATHGQNARLTARHFGISPSTFYLWKGRYDPHALSTLEDHSSRPRRCRQRTWTSDAVLAVKRLRQRFPRWGKAKLTVLLKKDGWTLSTSTVGRILSYLRRRQELPEPLRTTSTFRRQQRRPFATRKPKEYLAIRPGDIIQLDTVDLRPIPGVVLKQFTSVDVVSRWSVPFLAHAATAASATRALAAIRARMPFPVRAIQVDGGSEFMGVFEQATAALGIRLFVLPPHSPKLNGRVERANRTYREEFYDCSNETPTVRGLSPALRRFEHTYNMTRPHQALGYLTPAQFLAQAFPTSTDQEVPSGTS